MNECEGEIKMMKFQSGRLPTLFEKEEAPIWEPFVFQGILLERVRPNV
jgi:hypothetical protein